MGKMYNELKKFFTVPSVLIGIAVSLVLFWVLPLLLPDNINQPPDYTSFYRARADVEYETLLTRANDFIQEDKDFTENGITDYRSFFMGVQARLIYLETLSQEVAEEAYDEYCLTMTGEDETPFAVRLSKETAGKLYEKAYGFPYRDNLFHYYETHLEIPEEPFYTFLLLQTYNDRGTHMYTPESEYDGNDMELPSSYDVYVNANGANHVTEEQYYSIMPKVVFSSYLRLLRIIFLAVSMGLATMLLLSSNVAESKTLRSLQYVSKTGRKIVNYKINAILVITLVTSMVMLVSIFISGRKYSFTQFLGGYINSYQNQTAAVVPVQISFGMYILLSFLCMFLMTFFICMLAFVFDSAIHNRALRFFMLIPMGAMSYWLITFMTAHYPEDPHEKLANLSIPLCEVLIPLGLCGMALTTAILVQKRQRKNI